MNQLICPKCKNVLSISDNSYKCCQNHCYDIAKEGYVNLLISNKKGSLIGDNRDMALSRREFLNKGYFKILADQLKTELDNINLDSPVVLDICCGEGYYSSYLKNNCTGNFFGFDISKEMIRLAAKRKSGVDYFVANMTQIPMKDNSVDFAFELFAPFYENEFFRVLKPGGTLITVTPGSNHLISLKKAIYDEAYINDESPSATDNLKLVGQKKITEDIYLDSNSDILSLFKMTPYYYHTDKKSKEKLDSIDSLKTEIEFVLSFYKK